MVSPVGSTAKSLPSQTVPPRLEAWVEILDDLIRIPGTNIRIGLDVVLGFMPVIGDFAGMLCGLPLLVAGIRGRVGWRILLVMTVNVLLDAVLGSVPLIGDIFDVLWKSHRKNLQLLREPESLSYLLREARGKISAMIAIVMLLGVLLCGLLLFAVRAWIFILEWGFGSVALGV